MVTKQKHQTINPEILAPAGSKAAFLAAIAAGADAIYCGLKQFSARMAAPNFSFEELAALTRLAHSRGIRVYIGTFSIILYAHNQIINLDGSVKSPTSALCCISQTFNVH